MRIELNPDWSEFLRLLLSHHVRFVLVGGHAVAGFLAGQDAQPLGSRLPSGSHGGADPVDFFLGGMRPFLLGGASGLQKLAEIRPREEPRQPTGVEEFDRVLGGGLVPGGVVAVWCYTLVRVTPAVDAVVDRFYHETVGPWWPSQRALTDDDVIDVLRKGVKKRKESVEAYTQGGRTELAAQEAAEAAMLERYLPAAASEDDVRAAVRAAIAAGAKAVGPVMGAAGEIDWPSAVRQRNSASSPLIVLIASSSGFVTWVSTSSGAAPGMSRCA